MRGLTHSKTREIPLFMGEGTWYAWCHKIEHHNRNCDTHSQNTAVLPIPVVNPRGMGNTMCFWPGVCWGMGTVLHFDTRTLTITSRGFYTVFGHTPDSVRNFISYLPGGRGALHTHCLCWS